MTDNAESKVRQWVTNRNGHALTATDAVELALAIDEDAIAREQRIIASSKERHNETVTILESHCAEALLRDERITVLEKWRHEQATTCERRVRDLITSEHSVRHEAHMSEEHRMPRREGDPEETDYTGDRRVWVMWNVGSKVTNVLISIITAAIVMLVSYLFFGAP